MGFTAAGLCDIVLLFVELLNFKRFAGGSCSSGGYGNDLLPDRGLPTDASLG